MSVPLDGSASEFLHKIQNESSSVKGCFTDNLSLQIDTVDFEKERFVCKTRERQSSPTYFWIEYEVYWHPSINKVLFLEGKSVLKWTSIDITIIKLHESLGQAKYTGLSVDDNIKNSWGDIEKSLFQNMSKNFIAWDCGNGYVIIDYETPEESKWKDKGFFMMYIVDRQNYWDFCSTIEGFL